MPTVEQVLPKLTAKLREQQRHAELFDAYYTGEHRIGLIEAEYRDTFGELPDEARSLALRPPDTNVAAVGIDALSERLAIAAFRAAPAEPVADGVTPPRDAAAEAAASRLLEENDLDVQQSVGVTEALVKGRSFLLASPGADGTVVSLEDASQVAVLYDPEPPYNVAAAFKSYPDPWTGAALGKVWVRPDPTPENPRPRVLRYDLTQPTSGALWVPAAYREAQLRQGIVGGWQLSDPVTLPWQEVPVGELAYRTRLVREPHSYIEPIASLADSYALLLAYLVIAARYGAIPVKWLAGVPLPRDAAGNVMPFGWDPRNPDAPPRRFGAQNALASEDPGAKFGTLEAGQLAGFIGAIDSILSSVTAITRVPQHYYGRGSSSGISGETLKTSEAGLDRRVEDVQRYFGQPWRKIVSLAVSTDLGRPVRLFPQWVDTRTRVEAMTADALQKYVASGLDLQTALERVSFPPELIRDALARVEQQKARAALLLEGVNAVTGAGGGSADLLEPDDGEGGGGGTSALRADVTPAGVPGAGETGSGTAATRAA